MNLKKIIADVGNLQLDIKPRLLLFQGGRYKHFVLNVEKGRQLIGQFKSDIKHSGKESRYLFSSYQPSLFRVTNLQNTKYCWNIYFVNVQEMVQKYMDMAVFDLKTLIETYQTQICNKEIQLQASIKDYSSNPEAMLEGWKMIKQELTSKTIKLEAFFSKQKIHLQFIVSIRNELDLQLAKKEQLKLKKSMKQLKPKLFYSSPDLNKVVNLPVLVREDSPLADEDDIDGLQLENQQDTDVANLAELKITKVLSQQQINDTAPRRQDDFYQEDDFDEEEDTAQAQIEQSLGIGKSLSDILERSYEGSSSYGQSHTKNTSLRFKFVPKMERLNHSSSPKLINQFQNVTKSYGYSTLIREEVEKDQSNEILLKPQSLFKEPAQQQLPQKDNYESKYFVIYNKRKNSQLKWIVCFILLVILLIFAGEWIIGNQSKRARILKRMKTH